LNVLHILDEAEVEMTAAALWYESKRPGLGAEYLAAIDESFESISSRPLSFPVWRTGRPFRRLVVSRFPFVVFFSASPDAITVMAVAHARRRPGYWLHR
jgi:plasmid stabilization system protein ParE